MKPADRTRLTAALREQVAEDFDVWTDLLSRRAAVLWVLKSVYVRVLEDRRLLSPGRLFDPGPAALRDARAEPR